MESGESMQSEQGSTTKATYLNQWIWSTWLKEQWPPRLEYKRFRYMEFVEDETKRPEIESDLAKLLYEYHSHLPVDTSLLTHLKYRQLASVLTGSFDQRPRDRPTRSGNFIEILACELAKKQGYDIPVLRLQYNPNRDQSMKGDDISGFRVTGDEAGKSTVLIGEGKFRSDFAEEAVREAYDGLKVKVRSGPISMEFIAAMLSREGDRQEAAKIIKLRKQILQQDPKITQEYLLFLGTVGQPRNPFKYLEEYNNGLLSNLVAVNVVFKTGLQDWLNEVYEQEYGH
jgi:hypothetical protein